MKVRQTMIQLLVELSEARTMLDVNVAAGKAWQALSEVKDEVDTVKPMASRETTD